MPLSAEQVYNSLDGEEVKEILFTRLADLLNGVPEFRRNITLPRVRMRLQISLEIIGRNPPDLSISDELVVRMRDVQTFEATPEDDLIEHELEASVIADTSVDGGQPPDQIREEHGLPILEPHRGAFGIEDVPVVRPGIKYAAFVTQDHGPARGRTGNEGPAIGAEVIAQKGQGRAEVPLDLSKVKDQNYQDRYKPGDVNAK